jgi:uncharacterized protein
MAKPMGPVCNLDCTYCYYVEKKTLFPDTSSFLMSEAVLHAYIRQYIASQPTKEITFSWQGGEPLLAGRAFFENALALQKRYAGEKTVYNSIQTNATLIDEQWAAFLAQHGFLVGVSIDGPAEIHDTYRKDTRHRGSHERVVRGLRNLQAHEVDYNALVTVNRANVHRGVEVYRYLKNLGVTHIQFIPLVERNPDEKAHTSGLHLSYPPHAQNDAHTGSVTDWSADPQALGKFWCGIYDEWLQGDMPHISIQLFDVALHKWMRLPDALCSAQRVCGNAALLEHNGDLFSCDHYVYPQYKLGNILHTSLDELMQSAQQRRFGEAKDTALPSYCRTCQYLWLCRGGCPKARIQKSPDGEDGLNYFCAAYKTFFTHSTPTMKVIASLLRQGYASERIQQYMLQQLPRAAAATPGRAGKKQIGRNDPCPCGSGRKYKQCCGRNA